MLGLCLMLGVMLFCFMPDRILGWLAAAPGGLFVLNHRWGVFAAGAAFAIVVYALIESRRRCPACGTRGFTRVMYHGPGDDRAAEPAYGVRHCRACGIRQVECARGTRVLGSEQWQSEAALFAGRLPPMMTTPERGFEVIQSDPPPAPPA